jgi:hypothetical protein
MIFADDKQLYLSFSPEDQANALQEMQTCILDIQSWIDCNSLKLNGDKAECMIIGSKHQLAKCDAAVLRIDNVDIHYVYGILGLCLTKQVCVNGGSGRAYMSVILYES